MTPRQSRDLFDRYWRAVAWANWVARQEARDRAGTQYVEREERDEAVADMNSYRARVL